MRSGNGHYVCVTRMAGESWGAVGKGDQGEMESVEGLGALQGIRFRNMKGL